MGSPASCLKCMALPVWPSDSCAMGAVCQITTKDKDKKEVKGEGKDDDKDDDDKEEDEGEAADEEDTDDDHGKARNQFGQKGSGCVRVGTAASLRAMKRYVVDQFSEQGRKLAVGEIQLVFDKTSVWAWFLLRVALLMQLTC